MQPIKLSEVATVKCSSKEHTHREEMPELCQGNSPQLPRFLPSPASGSASFGHWNEIKSKGKVLGQACFHQPFLNHLFFCRVSQTLHNLKPWQSTPHRNSRANAAHIKVLRFTEEQRVISLPCFCSLYFMKCFKSKLAFPLFGHVCPLRFRTLHYQFLLNRASWLSLVFYSVTRSASATA